MSLIKCTKPIETLLFKVDGQANTRLIRSCPLSERQSTDGQISSNNDKVWEFLGLLAHHHAKGQPWYKDMLYNPGSFKWCVNRNTFNNVWMGNLIPFLTFTLRSYIAKLLGKDMNSFQNFNRHRLWFYLLYGRSCTLSSTSK